MSRRLPPISPAKEAFINAIPPTVEPPKALPGPTDLSIDALMTKGLTAIYGVMRACMAEAATPSPSRESVMNLKDCMSMLHELKKKELELLEELSDEDLEKVANANS